jgi:hypothetical protein
VQQLALTFADKAAVLVELNESAYAYRTGGLRDDDEEVSGGRGVMRHRRLWGGRQRAGQSVLEEGVAAAAVASCDVCFVNT